MAADSIHVRVGGQLQVHLQQQIGENGLYENASEYIRALIRRDLQVTKHGTGSSGKSSQA